MHHLQPKQTGIVYFDSEPKNARIYVDGQILTDPDSEESLRTPTKVLLLEGRRYFTYSLEGYQDESGYVDVFPGSTVNIFRSLKPGKSEEGWGSQHQRYQLQDQPGFLKVYSIPDGADIYIDDKLVGKAPTVISNVPPGTRKVTFKMPGMVDEERKVDIFPGAYSSIQITMRPPNYPPYQFMEYTRVMATLQQPSKDISGDVVITTYPAGATIYMDGKLVIDADTKEPILTPVDLIMYIGTHNLVFKLSGYYDEFATVYVTPGFTSYVHNNFNVG